MLTFRNYYFCQQESGDSVELYDPGVERRFLAFDKLLGHFVDFHVFPGDDLDREEFRSRCQEARELRSSSLARFVAWGEDDDMSFYITRLADGPNLDAYFRWLGEVPRSLFAQLVQQYARLLRDVAPRFDLLPELSVKDFQVVSTTEGQIRLLLTRFGLQHGDPVNSDQGKKDGKSIAAFPVLDSLLYPRGGEGETIPAEEAAEAFTALLAVDPEVGRRQFHSLEKTIEEEGLATREVDPIHSPTPLLLETILGGTAALERQLDERFTPLDGEGWRAGSYTKRCRDKETGKTVQVGFLPTERILPKEGLRTLNDLLARSGDEESARFLVPLIGWKAGKGSKLFCYAEELANGFSLASYLRGRGGHLQPGEVRKILERVERSLQELAGARSLLPRLQPEDVFFHFANRSEMTEAEVDRLCKVRVGELPEHQLRLRAHATMDSLADGWSPVPRLSEAPMAKGSASDIARLAPALSSRLFTDLGFVLLGLSPDDREEKIRSRGFSSSLERLLLDERAGKFRTGPPVPPARFLERFRTAVSERPSGRPQGDRFQKIGSQSGGGGSLGSLVGLGSEGSGSPRPEGLNPVASSPPTSIASGKSIDGQAGSSSTGGSEANELLGPSQPSQVIASPFQSEEEPTEMGGEGGFAEVLFSADTPVPNDGHESGGTIRGVSSVPSRQGASLSPSSDAQAILRSQRRRGIFKTLAAACLGLLSAWGVYHFLTTEEADQDSGAGAIVNAAEVEDPQETGNQEDSEQPNRIAGPGVPETNNIVPAGSPDSPDSETPVLKVSPPLPSDGVPDSGQVLPDGSVEDNRAVPEPPAPRVVLAVPLEENAGVSGPPLRTEAVDPPSIANLEFPRAVVLAPEPAPSAVNSNPAKTSEAEGRPIVQGPPSATAGGRPARSQVEDLSPTSLVGGGSGPSPRGPELGESPVATVSISGSEDVASIVVEDIVLPDDNRATGVSLRPAKPGGISFGPGATSQSTPILPSREESRDRFFQAGLEGLEPSNPASSGPVVPAGPRNPSGDTPPRIPTAPPALPAPIPPAPTPEIPRARVFEDRRL